MPELAEVEYFRKRWSPGFGQKVKRVHLHGGKRLFRGHPEREIIKALTSSNLESSERKAKQMLFRFSRSTLGIHLGMTGELTIESLDFQPGKHDHLVLFMEDVALVFNDPRLFGRVRLTTGNKDPDWWSEMPPELDSKAFTQKTLDTILERRAKAPLKALLLMQQFFPGIGNWMADEILWQAGLSPKLKPNAMDEMQRKALFKATKHVVKLSLQTIGRDFRDPPEEWLFHQRWTAKGICPKHGTTLSTATVGGRTTRWCERCQRT